MGFKVGALVVIQPELVRALNALVDDARIGRGFHLPEGRVYQVTELAGADGLLTAHDIETARVHYFAESDIEAAPRRSEWKAEDFDAGLLRMLTEGVEYTRETIELWKKLPRATYWTARALPIVSDPVGPGMIATMLGDVSPNTDNYFAEDAEKRLYHSCFAVRAPVPVLASGFVMRWFIRTNDAEITAAWVYAHEPPHELIECDPESVKERSTAEDILKRGLSRLKALGERCSRCVATLNTLLAALPGAANADVDELAKLCVAHFSERAVKLHYGESGELLRVEELPWMKKVRDGG